MANDSSDNTIKYQVKSGQGFMLFPNQINTYIADQDLPWEYTWVEFDGLRAKEIVSTAGLQSRSSGLSRRFKKTFAMK